MLSPVYIPKIRMASQSILKKCLHVENWYSINVQFVANSSATIYYLLLEAHKFIICSIIITGKCRLTAIKLQHAHLI